MTSDIERRMREAFGAYADLVRIDDAGADAEAETVPTVPTVPARPRRLRGRPALAAAACVAVIAGGAAYLGSSASSGGGPDHGPAATAPVTTTPTSSPPSVDDTGEGAYAALVLHDGDTVTATGQVVSVPGRPVRFCAPGVKDAVGSIGDPAITHCIGVDVTGVDLSSLAGRHANDGAVEGRARLTGVYRAGTLAVTGQERPGKPVEVAVDSLFPQPPCTAPSGGWPRGPKDANLDSTAVTAYRHAHPGAILEFTKLRPSSTQVVMYVLTTGDPAPVRAALQDDYGQRLCVAHSRYTAAQVTAARALSGTSTFVAAGMCLSFGDLLAADGQIQVVDQLVRVTPDVARLAATQPAGLVVLNPWLRPQRE